MKKMKGQVKLRTKIKNVRGITLIALVVTIIVLLIIAGVSIATLTGEKGILTQANRAKEETEEAKIEEENKLKLADALMQEPWDGNAAESFAGGSGTVEDPYIIENAQQLAYLSEQVNNGEKYEGKYFSITKSINLGNQEFTPIEKGTQNNSQSVNLGFQGIIEGNENVIVNIKIETPEIYGVGLVGVLGEKGEVKNLKVFSGKMIGRNYVGGIVGINKGKIENCTNGANMVAKYNGSDSGIVSGGIAGYQIKGTITSCRNEGEIVAEYQRAGGIVGTQEAGKISKAYNKGNIVGTEVIGAVVGQKKLAGQIEKTYYYTQQEIKGIGSESDSTATIHPVDEVRGKVEKIEEDIKTFEEFLKWIEKK